MTKLNRREYLKGLGATAGAIAVAGNEVLGQKRKPKTQKQPKSKDAKPAEQKPKPNSSVGSAESVIKSERPLVWKRQWADALPDADPNEVIKLIFLGQNGFSSRTARSTC